MTDTIVSVNQLKKDFADQVLNNVTFHLKRDEFVSLLGPSGCGKTVLLKNLSGLIKKTAGDIHFNFREHTQVPVSMAFQKSPLFPWLTVLKNITICMNYSSLSAAQKEAEALDYLKTAHLENFRDYYPHEISGGMGQKVNVIRSFCSGSELVLMDEPFGALDFIQRTELQKFTLDIWTKKKKNDLFCDP